VSGAVSGAQKPRRSCTGRGQPGPGRHGNTTPCVPPACPTLGVAFKCGSPTAEVGFW
jgi:hypothetical protein